jgi:hypothetical protein
MLVRSSWVGFPLAGLPEPQIEAGQFQTMAARMVPKPHFLARAMPLENGEPALWALLEPLGSGVCLFSNCPRRHGTACCAAMRRSRRRRRRCRPVGC